MRRTRFPLLAGLLIGVGLLLIVLLISVLYGARDIVARDVGAAFIAFDPTSTEHLIIRTLRVPRALVAALAGAALAVAGAIMQGITRNPLADAGILGINSGAALGMVLAVFLVGGASFTTYSLFAMLGAAISGAVVYLLGSLGRGGSSPLALTLAGVALTALLSSITTGILILNQSTLEEVRFWLAGSVAGRDLKTLLQVAPWLIGGLLLAFSMGRQITALSLGEDVARGLGQNAARVQLLAALAVVLLAGASVAVAGPIAFVGLAVPHSVRALVGVDYRWILPYSAVAGALFLILSDLLARLSMRPLELPVGVVTSLIGGLFFVYLVSGHMRR